MVNMKKTVKIYDKEFELFIKSSEISEMVDRIAMDLTK